MTADPLEQSLVCILDHNGIPVGAGCLITQQYVVTCAHVVASAIGYDEYSAEKPTDTVLIQFFLQGEDKPTVETWWPVAPEGREPLDGRADLALLSLTKSLPPGAKPARLADSDNLRHQHFVTKGFPQRLGVDAEGVCGGRRRDGRIQVQKQTGYPFSPGFSGSPVWIEAYGAIGGILVERILSKEAPSLGFVIPPSLLRAICPMAGAMEPRLAPLKWVPDPPPGYVQRPERLAELKATLLAASEMETTTGGRRRTALRGMGGLGKTVLASALARDEDVRRAFPDGIYWLTLGQHSNALERQRQLAHELSKGKEEFKDIQGGKARLEELLSGKRCLIILDDVWFARDARTFSLSNTPTQLLITTRDSRVVDVFGATELPVRLASDGEARDLLASFSGRSVSTLSPQAAEVIAAAGGVPLAIAIAGRLAQGHPGAWGEIAARLHGAELAAPRGNEEFPWPSVEAAIEASVLELPPASQELVFDLVVTAQNVPIPLRIVECVWAERGLSRLDTAHQADDLVAKSLASWDEKREGDQLKYRLVLHDLVFGYLLRKKVPDIEERSRWVNAAIVREFAEDPEIKDWFDAFALAALIRKGERLQAEGRLREAISECYETGVLRYGASMSAPALGSYNAAIDDSSVSGAYSGAFMAVQFATAWSAVINGVGIMAGGPYYCAQGTANGAMTGNFFAGATYWLVDPPGDLAPIFERIDAWAGNGDIDDPMHLNHQKIYICAPFNSAFAGPALTNATVAFYDHYLRKDNSNNLFYQDVFQPAFSQIRSIYPNRISQHESNIANLIHSIYRSIWAGGITQIESNDAKLDNYDLIGGILQHIYGTLNPKNTGKLSGTLKPFDQREFASPECPASYSMADIGFMYVPASCEQQQRCRVHIVLHEEGAGPYMHHYTYLQWADTNNLIILFPQTIVGNPANKLFSPLNPWACWDWWGYTNMFYAEKRGRQIAMIKAMLDRVTQSAAPALGSPDREAGEVAKNLIINDASETAIALAWRPVRGSRLYQIHRSESAGEGFSVLGTVEGPSFCDRGLTPGTVYRYKIAALRPDGSVGPTSNVAAGSTR